MDFQIEHQFLPVKMASNHEFTSSPYLWHGMANREIQLNPIAKDTVTKPVCNGGLSIWHLKTQSRVFQAYTIQSFLQEPNAYWVKLLTQKYLKAYNIRTVPREIYKIPSCRSSDMADTFLTQPSKTIYYLIFSFCK